MKQLGTYLYRQITLLGGLRSYKHRAGRLGSKRCFKIVIDMPLKALVQWWSPFSHRASNENDAIDSVSNQ